MDEGEMYDRLETLPDRYAPAVPEPDRDGLYSLADGGEWELFLELLLAVLHAADVRLTAMERDDIEALLDALNVDRDNDLSEPAQDALTYYREHAVPSS